MDSFWLTDIVFWVMALPALVATGILAQMILSLFRCCGAFKLRGKAVQVTWWMIPATAALSALLWGLAGVYAFSLM